MTDSKDKKASPSGSTDELDSTTTIQLLSTTVLREMLDTDEVTVADLEATAMSAPDGMLGRDENGQFEVLAKSSLDDLMNAKPGPVRRPERSRNANPDFDYGKPARREEHAAAPPRRAGAESNVRQIELPESTDDNELELVSTAMLRVILDEQLVSQGKAPKFNVEEVPDGNPYDSADSPEPQSRFEPEGRRSDDFNPYNTGKPKR